NALIRAEKQAREEERDGKEKALTGRLQEEEKKKEEAQGRATANEGWKRTAYYLKTALALGEDQANKVTRANQRLDECPEDLQGWEWHYLKRLCRSELSSVSLGTGGVSLSALTPDGSRAIIRERNDLRVYDTATGQEVLHLAVKGDSKDLAISPDGKKLAMGGDDGGKWVVHVWDAASGKEITVLKGLDSERLVRRGVHAELWGIAFSADGRKVAGADMQGNLFVWDAATGEQQLQVAAHPNPNPKRGDTRLTKVSFNPDGTWLATTCIEDGVV